MLFDLEAIIIDALSNYVNLIMIPIVFNLSILTTHIGLFSTDGIRYILLRRFWELLLKRKEKLFN